MRRALLLTALTLASIQAPAQWTIQDAHTKASLRGIHSLGNRVAWASGTNGTVLRTEDGGTNWLPCTTPPNAEKLDFRGIQAFDNKTAIVMSSGTGDASRLYKTTDGCQTWTLVFANPDKDGFWDAIASPAFEPPEKSRSLLLLGDPTSAHPFNLWKVRRTETGTWKYERQFGGVWPLPTDPAARETAFAASNSSLVVLLPEDRFRYGIWFAGAGGPGGGYFFGEGPKCPQGSGTFCGEKVPVGASSATSGVFSIAFEARPKHLRGFYSSRADVVAVGGDYTKPDDASAVAAYSADWGRHWNRAATQPHGYRSAVAYDATNKTWITVGPNGTDISTDDGRNWRPLKPTPTDTPDADKNWNALSLPFVVGPNGRIGILQKDALAKEVARPSNETTRNER
jgi:hypothetical protein